MVAATREHFFLLNTIYLWGRRENTFCCPAFVYFGFMRLSCCLLVLVAYLALAPTAAAKPTSVWLNEASTAQMGLGVQEVEQIVRWAARERGLRYRGLTRRRPFTRTGQLVAGFGSLPEGKLGCVCLRYWERDNKLVTGLVINRAIEWSAAEGAPEVGRRDLRLTMIHELGHAAGLRHVDDCRDTMNPYSHVGDWFEAATGAVHSLHCSK